MRIQTVPCLSDNLSYLIIDEATQTCVIVDPSEASPFLETIRSQFLKLVAILTTHHHYDHIGGLAELPAVPVWSSARDRGRIPGSGGSNDRHVYDDSRTFSWNEITGVDSSIEIQTRHIPGHTEGQTAILVSDSKGFENGENLHVFVGDTLFALGCGRVLEGTPEQLFESLQVLKKLPPEARLYFGHEYTEKNVLFWLSHASRIKENLADGLVLDAALLKKILIEHNAESRPVAAPTLREESERNPFLRIKNASEFRRWRELRNLF